MKWIKLAPVLALCVGVTGCSRLQEAALPVPAKVNVAHPVAAEVKLARERLATLLAQDTKALDEFTQLTDAQMTLRALNCAKGVVIGRLDSVDDVRRLPLERRCFQEQDKELLELFGVRTVGVLMSQPALRPKQALGALALIPNGELANVNLAVVASEANVAVVVDSQQQAVAVELPSGKPLAEMPRVGSLYDGGVNLSPNGRVVALTPSGRAPVFVDVETGQQIWSMTGKPNQRMLAWMPDMVAWVMSDAEGEIQLADGLKGLLLKHPQSIKHTNFALPLPGKSGQMLVGSSNDLVLISHTRQPDGIDAKVVKTYAIAARNGVARQGHVMKNGRLVVYPAYPDMGWLDLETGESDTWRIAPLFSPSTVKVDETHLLMDSIRSSDKPPGPWLFDIERGTVTQASDLQGRGGLAPIGARAGFMRRGGELWLGDVIELDEEASPRSLSDVVAEHDLQQQLARLEAATQAAEMAPQAFSAGASPAPLRAAAVPALDGVPADAEVHMVGVYEPAGGRNIRVNVRHTNRPVVLVLSSYEPVTWLLSGSISRVAAVLVSSYGASNVMGQGKAQVLRIGSGYAYAAGSAEYVRLRQSVMQYTGSRDIKSFQGSYKGTEFSIGSGD